MKFSPLPFIALFLAGAVVYQWKIPLRIDWAWVCLVIAFAAMLHAMVLSVLSRSGETVAAMARLLSVIHEPPSPRNRLVRDAGGSCRRRPCLGAGRDPLTA